MLLDRLDQLIAERARLTRFDLADADVGRRWLGAGGGKLNALAGGVALFAGTEAALR